MGAVGGAAALGIGYIFRDEICNQGVEVKEPEQHASLDEQVIRQYKSTATNPLKGELDVVERTGTFGYGRVKTIGGCNVPGKPHLFGKVQAKLHDGTDFMVKPGTEVYNPLEGIVVEVQGGFKKNEDGTFEYSNTDNGKYGNYVVIEHDVNGTKIRTKYAHLGTFDEDLSDKIKASIGSKMNDKNPHSVNVPIKVSQEAQIGTVGMTGNLANENVKNSHLHMVGYVQQNGNWELFDLGQVIDYGIMPKEK